MVSSEIVSGNCAGNRHLKASLRDIATAKMQKINSAIMIKSMPVTVPSPKIMTIPDNQVRQVGICEYKAAALSLAHAFKDDEVAMYFIETDEAKHWTREEKWELHLSIMEYIVHAHILKGLVTTIGPNYDGVALW
jgi:hypothetical protein